MSLSPEIVVQLTAYKDAGDVAGYYSVLDANGHDYGNIAYEAATDTGLWGSMPTTSWRIKRRNMAWLSTAMLLCGI